MFSQASVFNICRVFFVFTNPIFGFQNGKHDNEKTVNFRLKNTRYLPDLQGKSLLIIALCYAFNYKSMVATNSLKVRETKRVIWAFLCSLAFAELRRVIKTLNTWFFQVVWKLETVCFAENSFGRNQWEIWMATEYSQLVAQLKAMEQGTFRGRYGEKRVKVNWKCWTFLLLVIFMSESKKCSRESKTILAILSKARTCRNWSFRKRRLILNLFLTVHSQVKVPP